MGRNDRSEDLLAQQTIPGILCLDQCRLDEVPVLAASDTSRDNLRIHAAVLEILPNLCERLLVDHGAHEIPEVGDISHLDVPHDRDGAIANFRPDRFGNVYSARRGALLPLVLETPARYGDRERDRIGRRMRDDAILAARLPDDPRVRLVPRHAGTDGLPHVIEDGGAAG